MGALWRRFREIMAQRKRKKQRRIRKFSPGRPAEAGFSTVRKSGPA
jgi:hypothetical protein